MELDKFRIRIINSVFMKLSCIEMIPYDQTVGMKLQPFNPILINSSRMLNKNQC